MPRSPFDNPVVLEDMSSLASRVKGWDALDGTTVLVTGAAGMLASYIVFFLAYLKTVHGVDIRMTALVRNRAKAGRRFGPLIDQVGFMVLEQDVCAQLPAQLDVEYAVHAASLASPQWYGRMPVETMLPNVTGTAHLLEHVRLRCDNLRSFLFVSSGSVYGEVTQAECCTEDTYGRLNFLALGNAYGLSKQMGEALCHAYWHEYGVPAICARVFHTYGPTMDWERDSRVFSEFVGNVVRNQDIVMRSEGSACRSFAYITDTVSQLLTVMLRGVPGESYNVGNDTNFTSVAELADMLVGLYPGKGIHVVRETRTDAGYSAATARKSPMSLSKVRRLGCEPLVSVEDGFKRTIDAIEWEVCL